MKQLIGTSQAGSELLVEQRSSASVCTSLELAAENGRI